MVRPTECGSLPTPSRQHVCRRPQRQASITYADEVPQVKTENRETAAPFARALVRACQSVSVFCLHLFTHMPQNSDSQINRGEDFAQKPPHFAFSSGLFLRQSAVFQRFVPYHRKKNGKFDQWLRPPEPLRGVLFSSKGSVGAATHKPFIHGGLRSTFLPIGAHPNMADGLNYSSKRGEAVVTALLHGRTRKREPKSTKPSHLSNYGSTLCVIRVKR